MKVLEPCPSASNNVVSFPEKSRSTSKKKVSTPVGVFDKSTLILIGLVLFLILYSKRK